MRHLISGLSAALLLAVAGFGAVPVLGAPPATAKLQPVSSYQIGIRPQYLVDQMQDGPLKRQLKSCENIPTSKSQFSIGHRGAAMQFPEHTRESYVAAARMGAGVLECDVTFTKDRELVCRHSQCDLHTTTNILAIPELAAKCSVPFTPHDPVTGAPANAKCCTSDLTISEFKRLTGKMDGANPKATTVADYLKGTPDWRTDAYAATGTLLTHKESIDLFKQLKVDMTPELKEASVAMPYEGDYTQEKYAQQMIDDYKAAGVSPKRVWAQSFNLNDNLYWIANEPAFGEQSVALIPVDLPSQIPAATAKLPQMAAQGVKVVAPPMWALLALDSKNRMVPSNYARVARENGFKIISWTLERSGTLTDGGGYYFQSVTPAVRGPGDYFTALDALANDVGIIGMFSDWPATVTYYANCTGR